MSMAHDTVAYASLGWTKVTTYHPIILSRFRDPHSRTPYGKIPARSQKGTSVFIRVQSHTRAHAGTTGRYDRLGPSPWGTLVLSTLVACVREKRTTSANKTSRPSNVDSILYFPRSAATTIAHVPRPWLTSSWVSTSRLSSSKVRVHPRQSYPALRTCLSNRGYQASL